MKPTQQMLKSQDVLEVTGFSRPTLWRYVKAGWFPKPKEIGPRAKRWRREDVEAWLRDPEAYGSETTKARLA